MSKSTWTELPRRSMPTDPNGALAHLVTHHGWEPRQAEVSMIQAHRYAHGVDGRPELADDRLDHTHAAAIGPTAKKRPLTWVIIGWNILMGIWLAYGIGVVSKTGSNCAAEVYSDACRAGTSIGGAVAIGGILFLTAIVDVILGVIWMVTKDDAR
jgi:hypothetical protein